MADFTWIPDYGGAEDSMPKVLSAAFGDGYVQQLPDGLNSLLRTWSWSFNDRSPADTTDIVNFLKAKGGYLQFTHVVPETSETVTVICSSWSKRWSAFNTYNISVKFVEQVQI